MSPVLGYMVSSRSYWTALEDYLRGKKIPEQANTTKKSTNKQKGFENQAGTSKTQVQLLLKQRINEWILNKIMYYP